MPMQKRAHSFLASGAVILALVGAALFTNARLDDREAVRVAREAARVERDVRERDIALYERRASEDPASAADRAQLAGLYLQRARDTGDPAYFLRAEDAARRALALRTDRNGKAYLVLASSLLARHEFAQAYDVAREMVTFAPDEPAYRALLAELQVELGDYDTARATFDTLQVHRRHPAVAPRLARWLELTGKRDVAERILREQWASIPARMDLPSEQRAWFALRLGDFLLRHGRVEEGEQVTRQGLALAPDDARLTLLLARAAALKADWPMVIEHVRAAGDAADISAFALAGDAARALDDSAQAADWWERAERRGIDQPEPYNRQWTLFRLEHGIAPAETRALLEREIQGRRDVYGWEQLALARLATGDVTGAESAMREALRLGTTDALLWWHASLVAERAGNAKEALELATRALDLNPRFHHLEAKRAQAFSADREGADPLGGRRNRGEGLASS